MDSLSTQSNTSIKLQNMKQDFVSPRNMVDIYSMYRSTDFNAKDFDEKIDCPIKIKTLELSQKENFGVSNCNTPGNDNSQIKNIILLKNNFITNLSIFIQIYVNDIYYLFNKIDSVVYKKVTAILDKNKYFIRFFKEITSLYETFSINLIQANNTITLHFKEDDVSPFNQINSAIDKTQENISNGFYDFAKTLQNKIILKGPLSASKMKEFYNKISLISKESASIMSILTKKRDKLNVKYSSIEKIFELFKKSFNDSEKLNNVLIKNEFFLLEYEYCQSVNRLFSKIGSFVTRYKEAIKELRTLATDFLNCIKETIEVYSEESKKMFGIEELLGNMLNSLSIDDDDLLYDANVGRLLNQQLKSFQTNLIKFSFVRNEDIYNDDLFTFDYYKNYEEFLDFFHYIIPSQFNTENTNLLIYQCNLTKIYGLFKRRKEVKIVITIQGTILIFDEKINKKNFDKMDIKQSKISIDQNNPLMIELSQLQSGMLFNSVLKIYLEADKEETVKEIERLFMQYNIK